MANFINGMATILIIIFGLQLVISFRLDIRRHCAAFMLLSGLISFFLSTFYIGTIWLWLGVPLVVSIPFSFYVFCRNKLSDRAPLAASSYILFGVFIGYCTYVFIEYPYPNYGWISHFYISRMLLIGFLCLGFFECLRDFRNDLLNYRRIARFIVMVTFGLVITAHFITDIIVTDSGNITIGVALVFVIILAALCTYLLSPAESKLDQLLYVFDGKMVEDGDTTLADTTQRQGEGAKHNNKNRSDWCLSTANHADSDAEKKVAQLKTLMETERLYREHGLSLAMIAERMGMREYILRRLINSYLGYRNFNEYLGDYRLRDVVKQFEDREQDFTPILTLAYNAGYQSISPFNRAFKRKYDTSPSAYRKLMQSQREA